MLSTETSQWKEARRYILEGLTCRSGIGEETLSSPSPLSSGVYTKGQLQVLASLELLHVLRKGWGSKVAAFGGGGKLKQNKTSSELFRGFSWVLLWLVFVGFRWVFVGVSLAFVGFRWVLLFSPFVVVPPPLFLFPSPPAILGWKPTLRERRPPQAVEHRPGHARSPNHRPWRHQLPYQPPCRKRTSALRPAAYLTNSFLRACVAHLPFESKQLPQILSAPFGALLPCSFAKGILQIRVSPLPLLGLHPGLHSRRRQAQTRPDDCQWARPAITNHCRHHHDAKKDLQPSPGGECWRNGASLSAWDMQALQDKVGQGHVSSNLGQIVKVYLAIADNERGNIPANGEESKNRNAPPCQKATGTSNSTSPKILLQQLPQTLAPLTPSICGSLPLEVQGVSNHTEATS